MERAAGGRVPRQAGKATRVRETRRWESRDSGVVEERERQRKRKTGWRICFLAAIRSSGCLSSFNFLADAAVSFEKDAFMMARTASSRGTNVLVGDLAHGCVVRLGCFLFVSFFLRVSSRSSLGLRGEPFLRPGCRTRCLFNGRGGENEGAPVAGCFELCLLSSRVAVAIRRKLKEMLTKIKRVKEDNNHQKSGDEVAGEVRRRRREGVKGGGKGFLLEKNEGRCAELDLTRATREMGEVKRRERECQKKKKGSRGKNDERGGRDQENTQTKTKKRGGK